MAEWLAPAIVQRRTRSAIRIASSLDDLTLQTGLTGAVYHHVVGVAIPTRVWARILSDGMKAET
jgi:hypothetical protein